MENGEEFEPLVINTHHHRLKGHFENYEGNVEFENGEPEFDEIRAEIARHYGVPFVEDEEELSKQEEGHIFVIDNKLVKNQRHYRAFCVVSR
ncbi:MAG: hypothetical protein AAB783_01460, partial [Patescibacteria group bacterium]